jgi:PilZ domain
MLKEKVSGTSMREIQAGLERLERQEWWRWATALFIMLLLSLGVFSLSLPGPRKDFFTLHHWDLAIPGLFVAILIFNIFVIHQQIRISRMRRQLSGQIGMLAALEVLRPASAQEQAGQRELRRAPRYPFDQRLKVKAQGEGEGEEIILYGRIIDLGEIGLGAVISGSLERGATVSLEFSTGPGKPTLLLTAVVRYARGFRHGFEFSGLLRNDLECLRSCFPESALATASR